jgi:hypothetical protein
MDDKQISEEIKRIDDGLDEVDNLAESGELIKAKELLHSIFYQRMSIEALGYFMNKVRGKCGD